MNTWHIALGAFAALAVVAGVPRLHRWLLRLEERGHLYYWHKKPESGAISSLGALQEAIEPGHEPAIVIGRELRADASARDLTLARLLSMLQAESIDMTALRAALDTAGADGLDVRALYADAVRIVVNVDPSRAALLPNMGD